MKNLKGHFVALFIVCVGFTMTSHASQTAPVDGKTTAYLQTVELVPNTPTYNTWARWIQNKERSNPVLGPNGNPINNSGGEDRQITITTRMSAVASSFALASPENSDGPPVPLPATGTPGQQITITVSTETLYESWTYEWDGSSSQGGWIQTDYSIHRCAPRPGGGVGVKCFKGAG